MYELIELTWTNRNTDKYKLKVTSIRPSRAPEITLTDVFLESAVIGVKSHQIRHRFPEVDRRRYKDDGMSSHGRHRILSGRQRALPLSPIQGHVRPKQGTLRPTNRPLRPTQRPLRPTDDPLEPKKALVDRKRVSSGRQRTTRRWFFRPIKDCLMPKKCSLANANNFMSNKVF